MISIKNILYKIFKNKNRTRNRNRNRTRNNLGNNLGNANIIIDTSKYYFYVHILKFAPSLKKLKKVYTYNP